MDQLARLRRDRFGEPRVAVPEPTPEALSYYRSGNVLWVVNNVWGLLLPSLILYFGVSARMRDWATRRGRKWIIAIALYFIAFTVITFLADLPAAQQKELAGLLRRLLAPFGG